MATSRRELLRRACGAVAATLSAPSAFIASVAVAETNLPRSAASYGAAVSLKDLKNDDALRAALVRYCEMITPVSELKWESLRPERGRFAFESADALADFATRNQLGLRGHTLVWYANMPAWTHEIDSSLAAERELTTHIQTVISRYKSVVRSWDVVNEAAPDAPRSVLDLRPCLWEKYLGRKYVEIAFRAAAAADPDAQLILNDYDIEYGDGRCLAKRETYRRLIFDLLDGGAPIRGVGLQGHLRGDKPIDRDGLEKFSEELQKAGLAVLVTELDVIDRDLPPTFVQRDDVIARQAVALLEPLSAGKPLDCVVTWGLSDRYSWISWAFPRKDGRANRPLPLDQDFVEKPFMQALRRFVKPKPA